MAFDAAVRRLVAFADRHALAGFAVSLAAFYSVTALPLGSLNPFAKTNVRVDDDGLVHVHRPSLYASEPNPMALSSDSFRDGRFEVRMTVGVAHLRARGPARIVAYSEGPRFQNWLVGQEGSGLHVRFAGRVAQFADVFEADREARLVVTFGENEIRLAKDEGAPRVAPLVGASHAWSERCRLVVGNELTGDRPWSGTIRALTIRPLDSDLPTFSLAATPPDQLTLAARDGSVRIPIERVDWPWHYKWEKYREHGGPYDAVTNGDRIRNVILTIPLGFFLALYLRTRRVLATLTFALVLGAFVSAVAELHQFLAPGRVASLGDVALNALGSVFGAASAITTRWQPSR
jgi:hypothetical protein